MTFTRAVAINNWGPAKFVVDGTTPANGTHSTVQAAITAASSGDTIFIRPGTYTENLTLKAGVNLVAFSGDGLSQTVIIIGKATFTAGQVFISNIALQTNSDYILVVSGSSAATVVFLQCLINCSNHTGVSVTNSSGIVEFLYCSGIIGTTGITYFTSVNSIVVEYCVFGNGSNSSTASTISAGLLDLLYSEFDIPITTSGTAALFVKSSLMVTSGSNSTCLTVGGSGANSVQNTELASGSASSVSISATMDAFMHNYISSGNTNAITGAGTINYSAITFAQGGSKTINVTTQTDCGTLAGSTTKAPSAGYLGQEIRSAVTSGVSMGASGSQNNITSISVTAGVWSITGLGYCTVTATNIAWGVSVNTTSATNGTAGDNFMQTNSSTGQQLAVTIANWVQVFTTTTTVYLVGQAQFTGGTASAGGRISAIRIG